MKWNFKDNGNLFSNPSDLVTLVEKPEFGKLLIDNGIDEYEMWGTLSFAVKTGYQGIVKLLLDSGKCER